MIKQGRAGVLWALVSLRAAPDVLRTQGNQRCCQVVVKKQQQRITGEDLTAKSHHGRSSDDNHVTLFLEQLLGHKCSVCLNERQKNRV